MIIHHFTNEESYKEIESSKVISPRSPKSAISGIPVFGRFLPYSHTQNGVYVMRDEDLVKWNSDSFAVNHFAQHKSRGKDLVKLTLEVGDKTRMEVLEESILYYEVLPLADKYGLKDSSWPKFFAKLPIFGYAGFKLYDKYVKSGVPLTEYREQYMLPVAFIRQAIPIEGLLKDVKIIPHTEKFERI